MQINVTTADIANGTPGNGESCPVANAIRRQTGCQAVHVGMACLLDGKLCLLPFSVLFHIAIYDFNGRMRPFSFQLAVRGKRKAASKPFDYTKLHDAVGVCTDDRPGDSCEAGSGETSTATGLRTRSQEIAAAI